MKTLIDRRLIIAKQHALIRMGHRPQIGLSSNRIRERTHQNGASGLQGVVTTTYRSPLISGIYHSVFCEGAKP